MGPREYTVRATRFQDRWYIEVPTLDTLTQCRSFSEVEQTAREAISRALDADMNKLAIAVELQPAWDGAPRKRA
jgi:hypothetical protein